MLQMNHSLQPAYLERKSFSSGVGRVTVKIGLSYSEICQSAVSWLQAGPKSNVNLGVIT